jgi:hypothetical protein
MAKSPKTIQDRLLEKASGAVTIQSLAEILDCSIHHLQPLIDNGYLRIIFNKPSLADIVIAKPSMPALYWLRQMFAPFYFRPLIRLRDVEWLMSNPQAYPEGEILKPRDWRMDKFRKICFRYKIPLTVDPLFGEMIDISGMFKLIFHFHASYKIPFKKDRAGLLTYLLNTLPIKQKSINGKPVSLKTPTFSARLSREINRIARLPIAQRTIQVMNLYECWRDARTIQECLTKMKEMEKFLERPRGSSGYVYKKGRKVAEVLRLDGRIERMKDSVINNPPGG